MKFKSIILCLCFLNFSCYAQQYKVKVKLQNLDQYKLKLAYPKNNKFIIDSNYTLENDWMVFKGKVDEPILATLLTPGIPSLRINVEGGIIPGPSLKFFLSNDEIEITGDANTIYVAQVKGGKQNEEWNQIKAQEMMLVGTDWLVTKLTFENTNPSDSALNKMMAVFQMENNARQLQLQKEFIQKNPNSLVSMYHLAGMLNSLPFEDLKAAYARLGTAHKESLYAKAIASKIKNLENTALGKLAVPINKKDINGNPVNLQSLKGKYVLIDFWGSWCGPCRASHPHLKELYKKYKDQGFEILGIAHEQRSTMEDNRRVWKDAITKDGLTWLQVLNNEDIDKFDAVKAYGVTAFPTKILLDKEGKIIARYIGETKAFDDKLKEIFGK